MKTRISYLAIMSFIISTSVVGQTKYFKTPKGKIINAVSYSKLKSDKLKDLKASFSQVSLKDEFKELYRNNDSIVYTYTWKFEIAKTEEKSTRAVGVEKYIGKVLPVKNLRTIDNKSIEISNLKAKPTLINFWFTTCKPCIDEIEALNKLKRTFKDSVNFIAITFEKKEVVAKFLKKHNYDFVQVVDAQSFMNELGVTGCPKNVFLNKNGKVVSVENGIPYEMKKDGNMKMGDSKKFAEILRKLL